MALALLSGGAGCTMVPTSGGPRLAEEDSGGDTLSQPYVRMIASPPKKDALPEDVVKGFQSAMASFDDSSLAVARKYLTPASATRWNPWRQTKVYDEGKIASLTGMDALKDAPQATVTLKGTAVATIDSEGRYTPATGTTEELFTLVRVQNQWRIDSPPDARLLSADDLDRAYRPIDLCYPPATLAAGLVVDRVWVPIEPSRGVAESRIRRLLAGPTTAIREAVTSAFPAGTDLNQITVEGDTVVVDFTPAVESVSADRLEEMKAQLAWTLGDLVTGRTVEIRVNGERFGESGLRFKPADYSTYDPDVLTGSAQGYYMQGGKLFRAKDKGGDLVAGPAGEQTTPFTAPAVSGESQPRVAALVNGNGVYVADMIQGHQWQRWIAGKKMTPPSWDRYRAVWSAETARSGDTRVWRAVEGRATRVQIPKELQQADITALRVSRDGARVAAVVDDGKGTSVVIGTIVRSGEQVTIDDLRTLVGPRDEQKIDGIAWQNAAELLVLSEGKGGQKLVTWSIMEGMVVTRPEAAITLDAQAKISSIAAAPDHVLAGADGGEVLTYIMEKRDWTTIAKDGAVQPAYPLG